MAFALKLALVVIILSCIMVASSFVRADISHLRYNRQSGNRVLALHLQHLETGPTPYPAAGFRPNKEFNLPRDQSLSFPLESSQQDGSRVSNSLLPHFSHQQNLHGFNKIAESLQPEFNEPEDALFISGNTRHQQVHRCCNSFPNGQFQSNNSITYNGRQPQGNNNNNRIIGDFNKLPELQPQRPDLVYGAPNKEKQQSRVFNSLPEPQTQAPILAQPQLQSEAKHSQYNYNSPSRLKQLLIARLQQANLADIERLRQTSVIQQSQSKTQNQKQQFLKNSPTLYVAPIQQQPQIQTQGQTQIQAESQTSHRYSNKSARLTDTRGERKEEIADTDAEIETGASFKKDGRKNAALTAAVPSTSAASVINYYPAFGYAQPLNAAYIASVQPVASAYTVVSPILQHQYAWAA